MAKPVELFASFDGDNWRYFRAGRDEADDRLFFYEKRATGGIRFRITERASIDVLGGFAFDRFLFEGEGYDDRDKNRVDIDGGPFAGLRGEIAF